MSDNKFHVCQYSRRRNGVDRRRHGRYYRVVMRRGPSAQGLFLDRRRRACAVRDRAELGGTIFITCFNPLDTSRMRGQITLGNVKDISLLRSTGREWLTCIYPAILLLLNQEFGEGEQTGDLRNKETPDERQ